MVDGVKTKDNKFLSCTHADRMTYLCCTHTPLRLLLQLHGVKRRFVYLYWVYLYRLGDQMQPVCGKPQCGPFQDPCIRPTGSAYNPPDLSIIHCYVQHHQQPLYFKDPVHIFRLNMLKCTYNLRTLKATT